MNPILFDFPEKIETERLLIRPCLPGDGQIVHEAIQHSLEELKQWLPFAHKQQTLEQTEENIRNAYALFIQRQDIRLHIFRKEDQHSLVQQDCTVYRGKLADLKLAIGAIPVGPKGGI